jgi:hypothetical protein
VKPVIESPLHLVPGATSLPITSHEHAHDSSICILTVPALTYARSFGFRLAHQYHSAFELFVREATRVETS